MTAKLKEVNDVLESGGCVRFVHKTGDCLLVPTNALAVWIDGRTYHAFVHKHMPAVRTETGSLEAGDLVIEWRKSLSAAAEPFAS